MAIVLVRLVDIFCNKTPPPFSLSLSLSLSLSVSISPRSRSFFCLLFDLLLLRAANLKIQFALHTHIHPRARTHAYTREITATQESRYLIIPEIM
jgi:hypothetical protein